MKMDLSTLQTLTKIAATQTADEKAVEQAFGNQAYAALVHKSGPLMNEQYRLGCEIIDKNEDLTKILGLYGFRLGRKSVSQLGMVPIIFMNGRILAADLFYRAGPKKFNPNNPDWAQYLIDITTRDEGQPQARSQTGKLQPLFHAERMLRTPESLGVKQGSQDLGKLRQHIDMEALRDTVADMCRQVKTAGVLRDFIERSGVGFAAIEAMEKAIAGSTKFARAVARTWPNSEWIPDNVQVQTKQAAEPDHVLLQVFVGEPTPELLKLAMNREQVTADLYKLGYSLDVNPNFSVAVTNVYEDSSVELHNPECPSISELLLSSGDRVKVLIGRQISACEMVEPARAHMGNATYPAPGTSTMFVPPRNPVNIVRLTPPADIEDGTVWTGNVTLWADTTVLPDDTREAGIPARDVSTDELYAFFNADLGVLSDPMYVLDRRKVGDVWHLGVATYPDGNSQLLVINPDATADKAGNVLNDKWRAIRVSYRTHEGSNSQATGYRSFNMDSVSGKRAPQWFCPPMAPATADDIRASILSNLNNVKSAAVIYDADHGTDGYRIDVGGHISRWMPRREAHIKLAGTLLVEPKQAGALLDQAKQTGNLKLWLQFPEKQASTMLQLVDREQFEDTMDPIFGIPRGREQRAVLRTQRTPIFTPNARIGDKVDTTRGVRNEPDSSLEKQKSVPDHILLQASPDQIAQYAETHGMPHVMDHAIFSAMAKTYDSEPFLDQYIVKIEDGVDALGRSIFQYYWKPQDWKNMYGQDDLQEIEDKLLNAFKGTGDCLLDLLKKSRYSAQGTSALS